MIHNFRRRHFGLDLANFRLACDDGLFSQYYYYPILEKLDTEITFFITTSFIKPGPSRKRFDGKYLSYVKSPEYMYDAVAHSRFDPFMTIEEVKWLASRGTVRFGAHSHYHDVILTTKPPKKPNSLWKIRRLSLQPEEIDQTHGIRSKLAYRGLERKSGKFVDRSEKEWLDYVKHDTECCLNWFQKHLSLQPTDYCFPFNEHNDRLISILNSFGFTTFFNGPRQKDKRVLLRTDVDQLPAP